MSAIVERLRYTLADHRRLWQHLRNGGAWHPSIDTARLADGIEALELATNALEATLDADEAGTHNEKSGQTLD